MLANANNQLKLTRKLTNMSETKPTSLERERPMEEELEKVNEKKIIQIRMLF